MKQLLVGAMIVVMSTVANAQQPAAPAPAAPPPPAARPAQAQPAPRPASAQPPGSAPPAEPAPAPAPPLSDAPNLRFEIAIADEGGGAPPIRKNVSVITRATNQFASVRSQGQLNAEHPLSIAAKAHGIGIGLSVDVRGVVQQNGKIPARVTVDYQPYWPEAKSLPSSVRAQVDLIFDEGRRMLISQAADPLSDRRTTIEVTVTVLK